MSNRVAFDSLKQPTSPAPVCNLRPFATFKQVSLVETQ